MPLKTPEINSARVNLSLTPPTNPEAEQALLACCILAGREAIDDCILRKLKAEDLSDRRHQVLWHVIEAMHREGLEVELLGVLDRLGSTLVSSIKGMERAPDATKTALQACGGIETVNSLTSLIESTMHTTQWLRIVQEKATLRRLTATAAQIAYKCCASGGETAEDVLREATASIMSLEHSAAGGVKDMRQGVAEMHDYLTTRNERGNMGIVCSGLDPLDKITGGIDPGELVIIAADPKAGKTALALRYAESALFPAEQSRRVGVLLFSLEMQAREIAFRLICQRGMINMGLFFEGFPGEVSRYERLRPEIEAAPLWVEENSDLTIHDIRATARRQVARHPQIQLIIVDHMGLIRKRDPRQHMHDAMTEITRDCKRMAKELNRAVLLLCQMNRKNRQGHQDEDEDSYTPPSAANIEYGAGAEQDANKLILIGRKSVNKREIIVPYQRAGGSGKFDPLWTPWCARFDNPKNNHLP